LVDATSAVVDFPFVGKVLTFMIGFRSVTATNDLTATPVQGGRHRVVPLCMQIFLLILRSSLLEPL